jgi:hypothetical protein
MTLYRWTQKLLKRAKYGDKFAASARCCCSKWFCVLTQGGAYECRQQKPDADSGDQVLSEHKTEQECNKECYERYFCVTNPDGTKECVPEGDVNNRPADGPYKESECQAKCSCPHCGNEACEAAATGGNELVVCCNRAEEIWEFKGGQWEIVAPCGNDPNSMCTGVTPAFPDDPEEGDRVSINCEGGFKDPPSGVTCPKCKYGCVEDSSTGEKKCEREPDSGEYLTEEECKPECEGLWFCTASDKCEKLAEPPSPGKEGYATEQECLDTAPDKCPPKRWRCEKPDKCINEIEQDGGTYYDTEQECLDAAPVNCPVPCSSYPFVGQGPPDTTIGSCFTSTNEETDDGGEKGESKSYNKGYVGFGGFGAFGVEKPGAYDGLTDDAGNLRYLIWKYTQKGSSAFTRKPDPDNCVQQESHSSYEWTLMMCKEGEFSEVSDIDSRVELDKYPASPVDCREGTSISYTVKVSFDSCAQDFAGSQCGLTLGLAPELPNGPTEC